MRFSVVQMNPQEDKAANLNAAERLVVEATERDRPDLIVLPENFTYLCDESGVLALKPAAARSVAERAIGMQEAELLMLERLRKGERIAGISGATAMVEHHLAR